MTRIFFSVTCILFILLSCTTFKQLDRVTQNMRVQGHNSFVVKNNGDTLFGNKLNGPSGTGKSYEAHYKRKQFISLDGNEYNVNDIQSFQDNYALYHKMMDKSILGDDITLFVKLLKKGKINLYSNGDRKHNDQVVDIFCFQKGNQPIKELSKDEIVSILSDNREALSKFNQYFHPERKHVNVKQLELNKIMEVIEIYNRG